MSTMRDLMMIVAENTILTEGEWRLSFTTMRDINDLVEARSPVSVRTLYHGTGDAFDIAQCQPLTHFGNRKAAVNRIAWNVDRGRTHADDDNYLYAVEFIARNPLRFYDNGFNHNLPAMIETIKRAVQKLDLPIPQFSYNADAIAEGVRSLGFDALVYRNRAENGTSYVALGPENIKRVVSTEVITGRDAVKLASQWHNERYDIR